MTYEQIIGDLKKKIYRPIYLLSGEESFFIDEIAEYIETHVLDEMEKEFNQTIIYGSDTSVGHILSLAKRYPIMANHQVIIVREAQDLGTLDEIASYLEKPVNSTLLVLAHKNKKIDKRKALYKRAEKVGVVFESPKLWDNQVEAWIPTYVRSKGYSIGNKSTQMLKENIGNDLCKIANELSKAMLNIPLGTEITPILIETYIGISKDYNIFELSRALASKNTLRANLILKNLMQNPKENPIQKVIPILYSFFVKLFLYQTNVGKVDPKTLSQIVESPRLTDYEQAAPHYSAGKLAQIIHDFRVYNLKSIGVDATSNTDSEELMRELIFKILH